MLSRKVLSLTKLKGMNRNPAAIMLQIQNPVYIYIYIYIYLLTYYLPAFTVTRKKKKTPWKEIKISWITALGKKEKNIIGQKIEKANSVTPVEKNLEICSQLVKRKIKPTVKCRNATITRVLNTSGANYKINLNRESEFSY